MTPVCAWTVPLIFSTEGWNFFFLVFYIFIFIFICFCCKVCAALHYCGLITSTIHWFLLSSNILKGFHINYLICPFKNSVKEGQWQSSFQMEKLMHREIWLLVFSVLGRVENRELGYSIFAIHITFHESIKLNLHLNFSLV